MAVVQGLLTEIHFRLQNIGLSGTSCFFLVVNTRTVLKNEKHVLSSSLIVAQ